MKEKTREKSMAGEHEGHRKRIIKKLESGVLLDHELLEIMLFPLLPRKNTNDLAHRLLQRFGSIPEVYSASIEELMTVKGIGESIAANIRCTGMVYRKHFLAAKDRFIGAFEPRNFVAYVSERYKDVDCEVMDVYLVGRNGEITKRRRFTDREGVSAEIGSAELSKLLAKEEPSGIVLVHNHPYGDAMPSQSDDETTNRCQLVCNMHGVLLCDHCIYAPEGVYSYYLSGALKEISRDYTLQSIGKKGEKETK